MNGWIDEGPSVKIVVMRKMLVKVSVLISRISLHGFTSSESIRHNAIPAVDYDVMRAKNNAILRPYKVLQVRKKNFSTE